MQILNRGIWLRMDNISSPDESYDMGYGYQPSPSSVDDQSPTETTGLSMLSDNSFAYCRTNSETSAFSEHTDENSWSETGSPMSSRSLKSPTRAVLSRLGMRQHKTIADDPDTVDLGKFTFDV